MGLFDGYFDPEQFGEGGGLLGRLLAVQQAQGQYQPGAGLDQVSSDPQTPSRASMLSPLLSNDGQPAQTPVSWQGSLANVGSSPSLVPSTPAPNTLMAQYAPARPMGFPLPGVFWPGTPENDAFVHSTINAGRAIGDAVGGILNNDDANKNSDSSANPAPITPRPDATPLGGGRGGQYVPGLTGPPNSALPGAPGRIYITDGNGNVVVDVTEERAKDITPGGSAGRKRKPNPQELDLLEKMRR